MTTHNMKVESAFLGQDGSRHYNVGRPCDNLRQTLDSALHGHPSTAVCECHPYIGMPEHWLVPFILCRWHCPAGVLSDSGDCCKSVSGTTPVLDQQGRCCSTGKLDACGFCNGVGLAVDYLGSCCTGLLDAGGCA